MPVDADVLSRIITPTTLHDPVVSRVVIKAEPADFVVEELPAYQPCGDGEHLFLWVEKCGVSGPELISRIAKALQIRSGEIGIAGQKDRHAITRQFVSVHRSCEPKLSRLDSDQIKILAVKPHQNKLRTGHLRGNRFTLTLRHDHVPFPPQTLDELRQQLNRLATEGFASYFGPQRFGHAGSTLSDGIELLAGRLSRKRWPFHQQRFMTRLVLSAVQSAVFNLVLERRVGDKSLVMPLPGDIVIRRHGTRPFLFDPAAAAPGGPAPSSEVPDLPQERGRQIGVSDSTEGHSSAFHQLIPAGPMPGPKMLAAAGVPYKVELAALSQLNLTGEEFARFAKLSSGTRRCMLEFPENVTAESLGDDCLQIRFDLRSGTYATVLLREIAQTVVDGGTTANVASTEDGTPTSSAAGEDAFTDADPDW